jgi:hypothetical protein
MLQSISLIGMEVDGCSVAAGRAFIFDRRGSLGEWLNVSAYETQGR